MSFSLPNRIFKYSIFYLQKGLYWPGFLYLLFNLVIVLLKLRIELFT